MKDFNLVFRHFLKRAFRDPMSLIFFIGLPIGLILLNITIFGEVDQEYAEIDIAVQKAAMVAVLTLAFQFFSADILIYSIYDDIRGNVRWRLLATPVSETVFYAGAMASSFAFSLLQATLIIGGASLIFDLAWSNVYVLIAAVLLTSIISQLMAMVIAQFTNKRKIASGILQGLCFLFMILSGIMFIPLGNSAVATFVQSYGTPLSLAWGAILNSGMGENNMSQVLINLGVLGAMIVALVSALVVLLRRKCI